MRTHIHITTYKKNNVLEVLLDSLVAFGYVREGNVFTIGDDNPPEALSVFKKYPFIDAYLTGKQHGIWANKNRGINYFLNGNDCEALLLLDNDIEFLKPGMLEEFEKASQADGQKHITGFIIDSDGKDGLEITFPRDAQTEYLKWHPGCHGCASWFTRDLVRKVGYMMKFPYFYGYEHSEHSDRALRIQGFAPEYYPSLRRSPKFIRDSSANFHAYDVDTTPEGPIYKANGPVYHARLALTKDGYDLNNTNHGLGFQELSIRRGNSIDEQGVKNALANFGSKNKTRRERRKKK